MICAHMLDAGHRGVVATLVRLQEFCIWSGMGAQMRVFVRQCLHCADTRSGDVVARPLGETVHGTAPNEVEVVRLDYFYAGESGPQASQGLSEDSGFGTSRLSWKILATSCRWSLWWFVPPKRLLGLC